MFMKILLIILLVMVICLICMNLHMQKKIQLLNDIKTQNTPTENDDDIPSITFEIHTSNTLMQLTAYKENTYVGSIIAFFEATEKTVLIGDLKVKEDYRRQGFGSILISTMVNITKITGYTKIYGNLVPSKTITMEQLIDFITKNGFKQNMNIPKLNRYELILK